MTFPYFLVIYVMPCTVPRWTRWSKLDATIRLAKTTPKASLSYERISPR